MKQLTYKLFASGLGTGYSPFAPGTVGSLLACLLVVLFGYPDAIGWEIQGSYHFVLLLISIICFILSIPVINNLEGEWGKDPSKVVLDEMVGMWIALLWVPPSWQTILVAFLLFRGFDIWKPLYIRRLERMSGGWGVMLDDVLAGIYTNLVLQIAYQFL